MVQNFMVSCMSPGYLGLLAQSALFGGIWQILVVSEQAADAANAFRSSTCATIEVWCVTSSLSSSPSVALVTNFGTSMGFVCTAVCQNGSTHTYTLRLR